MFTFIVDHKLRVVEVVLGLMRSIWRKVLGFRIISSQKHIIFMQFFWFFVSWTSDSYKTEEGVGSGFFWSNHRTGLVFKTMPPWRCRKLAPHTPRQIGPAHLVLVLFMLLLCFIFFPPIFSFIFIFLLLI
jgi:hypothetical protein